MCVYTFEYISICKKVLGQMKKEKRVKREKTGFICDFEYFMKNSCEKCRLSRLCEEYEKGCRDERRNVRKDKRSMVG